MMMILRPDKAKEVEELESEMIDQIESAKATSTTIVKNDLIL
jgi:hypothetical protein